MAAWACLTCAFAGCSMSGQERLVPRLEGRPWTVAGDPDLGDLTAPDQQPVDFSVWRAADGTWQLWSCIRRTKVGGHTRLFHRWEGRNLTDPDWRLMGVAMKADARYGETPGGLQAPHVVTLGGEYLMFYGDWVRICLARGRDGKHFERCLTGGDKGPALFAEGPADNARDPMAMRVGRLWYCYYTAFPNRQGAVFCRTSPDLKVWSEAYVVSVGGQGGYGPTSAECPFVVRRGGAYYLFRTQRYGRDAACHVYRSPDPLHFNIHSDTGYVCTLPMAAPEIVTHHGRDYVAFLLPDLKGIQIAMLAWNANGT
ncbi:MAG: hypothetical protein AMXMBFR83_20370 [Phycisphaerae bacterium]